MHNPSTKFFEKLDLTEKPHNPISLILEKPIKINETNTKKAEISFSSSHNQIFSKRAKFPKLNPKVDIPCPEEIAQVKQTDESLLFDRGLIKDLSYFPEVSSTKIQSFTNKMLLSLQTIKRLYEDMGSFKKEFLQFSWDFSMFFNNLIYFIVIPLELGFERNFLSHYNFFSIFLFIIEMLSDYMKRRRKIDKNNTEIHLLRNFISILFIIINNSLFKPKNSIYLYLLSSFYVLRIQNIKEIAKRLEDYSLISHLPALFCRLSIILGKLLVISHIYTCIWHHIGYFSSKEEITWLESKKIVSEDWEIRYFESFYFITGIFNKIAISEPNPGTIKEKIFLIFAFYSSYIILLYFILTNLPLDHNRIIKKNGLLNTFKETLHKHKIEPILSKKVQKYLNKKISAEQNPFESLLTNLPESLQEELKCHKNGVFLDKIPIFNDIFSDSTLKKLANIVKEQKFVPYELIFSQNNQDNPNFYIVKSGKIELFIQMPNKKVISLETFTSEGYFGEKELFLNESFKISARALSFTSLLMIKKEDFIRIIRENEEDYERFCQIKEKMTFDYDNFDLKCSFCFKKHLKGGCPFSQINLNKTEIIKKNISSISQNRTEFQRNFIKENALKTKKKFNKIYNDYSSDNERDFIKDNNNKTIEDDSLNESMFDSSEKRSDSFEEQHKQNLKRSYSAKEVPGFEKLKIYQVYYPKNNIDKTLEFYNLKKKKMVETFIYDKKNSLCSPSFYHDKKNSVCSSVLKESRSRLVNLGIIKEIDFKLQKEIVPAKFSTKSLDKGKISSKTSKKIKSTERVSLKMFILERFQSMFRRIITKR